ncbi:MAG: nucleoside recognition domain-containing protein [Rhodospirillaceae bacterium]|nr:nucleoside recognition domain-containing protein [Rhodospirillaceae bacterium]|tara:strand:- start:44 stop:1000 length:957 start_codon:yes stop_codon:yes gene_type:complete
MINITKIFNDIQSVTITLFKIMIPTIIVVKLFEELGLIIICTEIMKPLTGFIGLPSELAIVLTTTMLINLYAGLIVISAITFTQDLTLAQSTILAMFMLFTHGLPVEVLISSKSGVRAWVTIFIRVGSGIIFCFLLNHIMNSFSYFSKKISINLPKTLPNDDITYWIIGQFKSLFFILIIIILLIIFLEILKSLGIEKLIRLIFKPFLKFLGIGEKASTIAVVGVTLGVSFGGGLLIKEVSSGKIPRNDVFGVVCLINLFHSAFEDTSLMMLLNPSLIIILFGRAFFSILVVFFLMIIVKKLPDIFWEKYLINKNLSC